LTVGSSPEEINKLVVQMMKGSIKRKINDIVEKPSTPKKKLKPMNPSGKRKKWTPEEDAILLSVVSLKDYCDVKNSGESRRRHFNWKDAADLLDGRTSVQCKDRMRILVKQYE
jgi:hypothetical protein